MDIGPCVSVQSQTAGKEVISSGLPGLKEAMSFKEQLSARWEERADRQAFQWLWLQQWMCVFGVMWVQTVSRWNRR